MSTVRFKLWDTMHQCYIKNSIGLNVSSDGVYQLEANDFIVILPTGLKDRNGKEIWNGDLFKIGVEKEIFEVRFVHGCFLAYSNNKQYGLLGELQMRFILVIGNIYENSKLLEEK